MKSSRYALCIAALFFLSGTTGLIYQTVWMRILVRGFGVTVQATSTVVAVFMLGLALGALLSPLWSRRVARGLRGYAWIELAVGLSAVAVTKLMQFLPEIMAHLARTAHLEDGFGQITARVVVSGLVLLVPTTAMGATLPLLVDTLAQWRPGAVTTALLYGINTLGAVLGVLLTGFVLMAHFGETGTVCLGAGLNFSLAALAILLSRGVTDCESAAEVEASTGVASLRGGVTRLGLGLACLCGFVSVALEVVWTRLLVLLVGSSVYAFSLMLGSFLLGTGLGSLAALFVSTRDPRYPIPRSPLPSGKGDLWRKIGWLLLALSGMCAISLRMFLVLGENTTNPAYLYSPLVEASDVLRFAGIAAILVAPVTFIFGMLFPFCVAASSDNPDGTVTGRVYAWNTLGAVLGCLLSGFVLIPILTAQGVVIAAVALLFLVGLGILLYSGPAEWLKATVIGILAVVVIAFVVPVNNITLDILRRRLPGARFIRHVDGAGASVTIADTERYTRCLLLNGILTSNHTSAGDIMAHLPLLLQERPRQALIICLGVGDAARAAVEHLKAVDPEAGIEIVELQPEVVDAIPLFQPDGGATLHRPGVDIHVRDGRHHVLMSQRQYDLVIIDTTPPFYGSGAVNLYSRDFQALVRDHLTPTGIFMQWLPAPAFERDIWSVVRGATEVFPYQQLWVCPGWAGLILMSSKSPIDIDSATIDRRVRERGLDLLLPGLDAQFIRPWWVDKEWVKLRVAGATAVTDDMPLTEYPLGELWRGAPNVANLAELIPPEARLK